MTLHSDLEESIVSPSLMLHNMAGGGGGWWRGTGPHRCLGKLLLYVAMS